MKTRAEIKAIAKANFKANYWPVVGASVLISILIGAAASTGIGYIIVPALMVGLYFFYIATFFGDKDNAKIENIFNVGFAKFGRNLGSLLLEGLLIFAWSLLFYIPGIIKAYAYAMTPFILADCPEVGAVDAITISRRMMKGHKWEYFVFQLSFIGWGLLAVLTLGILDIFYVGPYLYTAEAGYYAELKKNAIAEGRVTPEQFAGAPLDGSQPAAAYQTPVTTPVIDVVETPVETVAEETYTEAPVSETVVEDIIPVTETVVEEVTPVTETVDDSVSETVSTTSDDDNSFVL